MARGVLYVHRNGLAIYAPPTPILLKVPFASDSVKDLDVISEEPILKEIKSAFAANKVVLPVSFVIVLANDTLFVKNFPNLPPHAPAKPAPASPNEPVPSAPTQTVKPYFPEELKKFHEDQEKQIEVFVDRVPFDSTSHKIISTAVSRQVVVTNKALFMAIKSVLQKLGCTVEAVVPALVFEKSVPVSAGFTPESAAAMLTHSDIIRQNDLSLNPVIAQPIMIGAKPGDQPPPKSRAYLLIGIFALLFLFMIGLYYFMYMRPQPTTPTPRPKRAASVKPTATAAPSPAASTAAELSTLQFQIQGDTNTASLSARLRTQLAALGVEDITVSSASIAAASTIVIFSSDIASPTREQVLEIVRGVSPRVSSQVANTDTKRVTVTFGR